MTREEKIRAIYKEMANKELNLGCKVRFDKGIYTIIDKKNVGFLDSYRGKDGNIHNTIVIEDGINSRCYSIKEVIGHPVMIGDVIDYTGEKKIDIVWSDSSCAIDIRDGENSLNLFNLWGNKRTPIEDQSDECIDYVYSLIKK